MFQSGKSEKAVKIEKKEVTRILKRQKIEQNRTLYILGQVGVDMSCESSCFTSICHLLHFEIFVFPEYWKHFLKEVF